MDIALRPSLKKFVEKQIKSGRYGSVADVMNAALVRLMQDDEEMDFAPGELQGMVDKGEADIARGNVMTLSDVRKHFRQRQTQPRAKRTKRAS